jgi:large subunit ribosomal protein L22
MAEQKTVKTEKKVEEKKAPAVAEQKVEVKPEVKTENKVDTKKEVKEVKPAKTEAVARGDSVRASKRHCMYIGNFIRGKTVDAAIAELEEVIAIKRAIPFKGEIPHRHGNMMSGRYPVEASKIFISLLKGLKGNIIVNGMDLDKTRISLVVSNWASRPRRKNGKSKRTHVTITAKPLEAAKEKNK